MAISRYVSPPRLWFINPLVRTVRHSSVVHHQLIRSYCWSLIIRLIVVSSFVFAIYHPSVTFVYLLFVHASLSFAQSFALFIFHLLICHYFIRSYYWAFNIRASVGSYFIPAITYSFVYLSFVRSSCHLIVRSFFFICWSFIISFARAIHHSFAYLYFVHHCVL